MSFNNLQLLTRCSVLAVRHYPPLSDILLSLHTPSPPSPHDSHSRCSVVERAWRRGAPSGSTHSRDYRSKRAPSADFSLFTGDTALPRFVDIRDYHGRRGLGHQSTRGGKNSGRSKLAPQGRDRVEEPGDRVDKCSSVP